MPNTCFVSVGSVPSTVLLYKMVIFEAREETASAGEAGTRGVKRVQAKPERVSKSTECRGGHNLI